MAIPDARWSSTCSRADFGSGPWCEGMTFARNAFATTVPKSWRATHSRSAMFGQHWKACSARTSTFQSAKDSWKRSRPQARSKATQNHWLSEQVFEWSGVPTTNLRVTFFMEWLTYIAGLIRSGRYVMPYDADSRFAPIAGRDVARAPAQHGRGLHQRKPFVVRTRPPHGQGPMTRLTRG